MVAWELRVKDNRELYDVEVDASFVLVIALAVKTGNKFIIEGQELRL